MAATKITGSITLKPNGTAITYLVTLSDGTVLDQPDGVTFRTKEAAIKYATAHAKTHIGEMESRAEETVALVL